MFTLKPFQAETLRAFESPRAHVLCVAPTGSGKSLVFERLAARSGARTLLVSPLAALARQQLARIRALGVPVEIGLGSLRNRNSGTEIRIINPEALSEAATNALRSWSPGLLVVDECHTILDWGESFRPAFNRIPGLVGELGIPQSLWLTATLDPDARARLRAALPHGLIEIGKFALPPALALTAARVDWPSRIEALSRCIRSQRGKGLLYVVTRESSARFARLVRALGKQASEYHAGMGGDERRAIEERFHDGKLDVVVATSAFGMGMDIPRLSWVVLAQAPGSISSLAQMIGRAGRAGSLGTAMILWHPEDFRLLEWQAAGSERKTRELHETLAFLESHRCRRRSLEDYFLRPPAGGAGPRSDRARGCGLCDVCDRRLLLPLVDRGEVEPFGLGAESSRLPSLSRDRDGVGGSDFPGLAPFC